MHWVLDQSDTRSGAPKWRVTGLHVAACRGQGVYCVVQFVCIASCVASDDSLSLWQHHPRSARCARDEQTDGAA
jgi:hypothetical protein